ncbi:MAG: S41 family peptidase [Candidatus Omnitrophica bacterium]|nr:S41 family peptidase [Candidatus Omnitrophota bacterium]
MYKKIVVVLLLGTVILFFSTFAISSSDKRKKDELYREVAIFSDALAIIQSDYVDETKPKDLIYGALRGMLAALDPHSQFMDPETYNELKIDTTGKFGGLGIEITIKDGLLTVVTPLEDSPAWKAGIKAGDRIVKINDDLTRDITLTDAVKKLRGRPGEAINVTVLRESEKKLIEFKLVRDIIKIEDIKEARIIKDGIGYIRITEFRESTPRDISIALQNLSKQGMNSLILDLRNNPGGLLDAAVSVSEKFLEKGKKVVSTRGRNKANQSMDFLSQEAHPITKLPMVVLINEGSASASEIVAAALQDHKRAIVLGVKSFGKGSVQTVIPLSDGSALRLTTSKYFTPAGHQIHGKGVMPDIVVEETKTETARVPEEPEKSEEIFNQIENKQAAPKKDTAAALKADNQLMRAVDILKGIGIFNRLKNSL